MGYLVDPGTVALVPRSGHRDDRDGPRLARHQQGRAGLAVGTTASLARCIPPRPVPCLRPKVAMKVLLRVRSTRAGMPTEAHIGLAPPVLAPRSVSPAASPPSSATSAAQLGCASSCMSSVRVASHMRPVVGLQGHHTARSGAL